MKLLILDINQIDSKLFEYFLNKVSTAKKNKVMRFRNMSDRIRTLFGEIMTKYQLSKEYSIPIENIKFEYNLYGKPYLVDNKNVHFNISHSGRYVITCLASTNVGVDIESIKPIDRQIALQFFTPAEANYLLSLPSNSQYLGFFEIWTRKESLIKNIGKGLSIHLDSFSVVEFKNGKYSLLNEIQINKNLYFFKQYSHLTNYVISVCSTTNNFPEQITEISYDNLLQHQF